MIWAVYAPGWSVSSSAESAPEFGKAKAPVCCAADEMTLGPLLVGDPGVRCNNESIVVNCQDRIGQRTRHAELAQHRAVSANQNRARGSALDHEATDECLGVANVATGGHVSEYRAWWVRNKDSAAGPSITKRCKVDEYATPRSVAVLAVAGPSPEKRCVQFIPSGDVRSNPGPPRRQNIRFQK